MIQLTLSTLVKSDSQPTFFPPTFAFIKLHLVKAAVEGKFVTKPPVPQTKKFAESH